MKSQGKIARSIGYKGEVLLRFNQSIEEIPDDTHYIFIIFQGKGVPFYIERISLRSPGVFQVKLQDVNSLEEVTNLINREFYLNQEELELPEKSDELLLVGFKVIDKTAGCIGHVSEILQLPGHSLLKVLNGQGKEILIPICDEYIVGFTENPNEVLVDIPEGLLDM